jgi:transcriptional regulator with XRE-family HTH domain
MDFFACVCRQGWKGTLFCAARLCYNKTVVWAGKRPMQPAVDKLTGRAWWRATGKNAMIKAQQSAARFETSYEVSRMILADKIISQRKKNGWSQEELAQAVGVSRQAVSKWEGAQSVPDLDKVLRLAQLFGVSTDFLLKDELEEAEYTAAPQEDAPQVRSVSMEEACAFLQVKALTAKRIAFATFLCILAPICLMVLAAASEVQALHISQAFAGGMGMIVLLLLVAAAVAIFISCGAKTSAFEYLEKEIFETQYGVSGMVKQRQQEYQDTYTRANILGACLCILSLVPLFAGFFMTENALLLIVLLSLMLGLIGIGVFFFISAGINWASMQKLLQEGDYTRQKKRAAAHTGAIATIYWLLVTAIFLGVSFVRRDWENSWIIWPVAGVLYAAIMVAAGALDRRAK